MKIELCYFGHSSLRKKAKPVEKITLEIRDACNQMIDQLESWNGAGVAATQVNINQRFFVLSLADKDEKGEWSSSPPKAFINPKISNPSQKTWTFEEGCLSIPGLSFHIERPWSIDIEAMDLDGKLIQKHLQGYPARQFMHENDHLNGVLIIDRIGKKSRNLIDPKLRKIKKKYG